ncbi:MAG: GNVR domain-containing protein, partial [Mariprofundales bacterium]
MHQQLRQDRAVEAALSEYVTILFNEKWIIIFVTIFVAAISIAYATLTPPQFKATTLLQAEQQSSQLGSSDLTSLLQGESSTATEIEILRSHTTLGQVIEQLNLDVIAQPAFFPFIGEFAFRHHDSADKLATPPLNINFLGQYAWGGEDIVVKYLEIPRALQNQQLTVVKNSDANFSLYAPDQDAPLLRGSVGEKVQDGDISIYISKLVAKEGTKFTLMRMDALTALEQLRERLITVEKAKNTAIILMQVKDYHAGQAQIIANAIADTYLLQNVERQSQEASQALIFLNTQIPEISRTLESAEQSRNDYRLQSGSVDLSLETHSLLQQVVDSEKEISSLEIKRMELSRKFADGHPLMVSMRQQYKKLQYEKQVLENKVQSLPKMEQKLLTLERDVQVNTALYTTLLAKSQELKVMQAGTIGYVRILDHALTPVIPDSPKRGAIVVVGVVVGGLLAILIAFLAHALRSGLD